MLSVDNIIIKVYLVVLWLLMINCFRGYQVLQLFRGNIPVILFQMTARRLGIGLSVRLTILLHLVRSCRRILLLRVNQFLMEVLAVLRLRPARG